MELRVDRAAAWMSRLGPAGRSVVCLVLLAAVTGVIALLEPHVPVLSLAVLYLLAILPVAVAWGLVYAAGVAVGGMLVFNFFFLPPLHTLTIQDSRNWFALLVFLVTAVVVSDLAARSRRRAQESALLAQVAGTLLEQEDVGAAARPRRRRARGRARRRHGDDRAEPRAARSAGRGHVPARRGRQADRRGRDGEAAAVERVVPGSRPARGSRPCSGSRSSASGSRVRCSRRRRFGGAT